jgi:hypothetical protein
MWAGWSFQRKRAGRSVPLERSHRRREHAGSVRSEEPDGKLTKVADGERKLTVCATCAVRPLRRMTPRRR